MFSLDDRVKYWLYNKPVDMRTSFNGLSGIVTNGMCASLKGGDVYIIMNASRNMMKMLRLEAGGLVLYAIRLDMGSRSGDTARRLIGGYRGAVQTDGYEVYQSF